RPRTKKSSEHSASRNHRPQQFRFKVFRRQVRDSHGPPAQQPEHIFPSQLANRSPRLEHAPQIAATGTVDVRWSGCKRVANDLANLPQRLLKLGVLPRILLRERSDLLRRLACILIERKCP